MEYEKDVLSYIASMKEGETFEDLWKTVWQYTPTVKGVASGFKGVFKVDWMFKLRDVLCPGPQ